MKRVFDICVASLLLLLFLPVLLIVAIAIRIRLGSPILFRQKRPGKHAIPFVIYKFRTMRDDKDEAGRLLPDSQRLTTLGRWIRKLSLDELPQLLNVIKGEMSLVGPRPLLMEYVPLYNERQARRHEVRPGMTGWAQVNGRNALTWEEKFELDVWYVEHSSFWLDLKIIWKTFLKVLSTDGVNSSSQETMPVFKGSPSHDA